MLANSSSVPRAGSNARGILQMVGKKTISNTGEAKVDRIEKNTLPHYLVIKITAAQECIMN